MPVKRRRRIASREKPAPPTPAPKPPNPVRECCKCGASSEEGHRIIPFKAPSEILGWWCDKCIYAVEPRLSLYRPKAPKRRPVRRRPRVRPR